MQTIVLRQPVLVTGLGVLMGIEAATFLVAALAHLGIQIPLGVAILAEPPIRPAMIVEGLCGLTLAIGALAVATRRSWAWPSALAAHVFSAGGVLLGMAALAAGRGPRTQLNDIYHPTILAFLVIGLILLATPAVRGQSVPEPRA